MASFGNFLSNAGLVARGMSDADTDWQQSRGREQAIADAQQNAILRGQRIQEGQMGLEEATRQRDTAARLRGAVSGAPAGATRADIYGRVRDTARETGELGVYESAEQAVMKLRDNGFLQLAIDALSGVDPNTAAQRFNSTGAGKVTALEYGRDPKSGDILVLGVDEPTGQKWTHAFNASAAAKLAGKVKREVHSSGGNFLVSEPGKPPTMISAPQKDVFDYKDGVLFNKSSGAWQQVNSDGDWKLGTITHGNMEVPVMYSKRGEVQQLGPGGVRTGLQARISQPTVPGGPVMVTLPGGQLAEFKPAAEAVPGTSGFLGFGGTPGTPGTPAQLVPVTPPEAPPVAGAQKAPDGKWYLRQGDGWAEVVVGNTAPKPKSEAPKPKAPKAEPKVETPAEPAPKPRAARDVDSRATEMETMKSVTGSAEAEQRRSQRESRTAQRKAELAKEFDARVSRLSKEDQMWLEDRVNVMTNAQKKAYRDAKEKQLLSKYQRTGI